MLTTLLLTLCTTALQHGDGTRNQAGAMEPKVLARASWPYAKADPNAPKKGELAVIRNAAELTAREPWSNLDAPQPVVEKKATDEVAKLLKVDGIDWNKQMLILVTAGPKSSGGWKVNIDSLKVDGKTLKVSWSATAPKGFATAAFTHPGQIILVERFDGPVTFTATAAKPDVKRD